MKHESNTLWKENFHFTTEIDGLEVHFDNVHGKGEAQGVSPKKMLLSSLAGCSGMDLVAFLQKKHKVPFSDFSMQTTGTLTEVLPKYYDQIHLTYTIRIAKEHQHLVNEGVTLSLEKFCGVQAMLEKAATITHEIVFLPEA